MGRVDLRITTWNTRGLVASVPYIRSLLKGYDILCITEHWLHTNRLVKLADISEKFDVFGRASKLSTSENFDILKRKGVWQFCGIRASRASPPLYKSNMIGSAGFVYRTTMLR